MSAERRANPKVTARRPVNPAPAPSWSEVTLPRDEGVSSLRLQRVKSSSRTGQWLPRRQRIDH